MDCEWIETNWVLEEILRIVRVFFVRKRKGKKEKTVRDTRYTNLGIACISLPIEVLTCCIDHLKINIHQPQQAFYP